MPRPPAGYFGKMPARGDFLSGGLDRGFMAPWDDWLTLSIEESRSGLGEQWLDVYLTSPVWCFALSPSICGSVPWSGVLMPSVDAVGRYFPLTIAAPVAPAINIVSLPASASKWYSDAEALARSSLDDAFDLAEFERQLADLGGPAGLLGAASHTEDDDPYVGVADAWRLGMPQQRQMSDDCPQLLHEALTRLMFAYSLWWTHGSSRVTPSYLLCQGLPPPQGFAAMLDGRWRQWGWDDRHVLMTGHGTVGESVDDCRRMT